MGERFSAFSSNLIDNKKMKDKYSRKTQTGAFIH